MPFTYINGKYTEVPAPGAPAPLYNQLRRVQTATQNKNAVAGTGRSFNPNTGYVLGLQQQNSQIERNMRMRQAQAQARLRGDVINTPTSSGPGWKTETDYSWLKPDYRQTFGQQLMTQQEYMTRRNAWSKLYQNPQSPAETLGPNGLPNPNGFLQTQDEWSRRNEAFQRTQPEYQEYSWLASQTPNQPHDIGSAWAQTYGRYQPAYVYSGFGSGYMGAPQQQPLPSLPTSTPGGAAGGYAAPYYGYGGWGGGRGGGDINTWLEKTMNWQIGVPQGG